MSHRSYFYPGPREGNNTQFKELMGLYERFNVNFIINGHDHVYRRMDVHKNNAPLLTHLCVGGSGGIFNEINYWGDQITEEYSAVIQKVNPAPHYLALTVKDDEVRAVVKTLSGNILDQVAIKVFSNGSISYLFGDSPSKGLNTLLITPFRIMEYVSLYTFILSVVLGAGAIFTFCAGGKAYSPHFSGLRDYVRETIHELINYKCSEPENESQIKPYGSTKKRVSFYLININRALLCICATHLSAALSMALYSFCCVVFYGYYGYENLSLYLSTQLILIFACTYFLLVIYFVDPYLVRIFCNGVVFTIYLFSLNLFHKEIESHFVYSYKRGIRLFSLLFSLFLEIVLPICLTELSHFFESLQQFRLNWFKALYTNYPFALWNWSPKYTLHWGCLAITNAFFIADFIYGYYGLSVFSAVSLLINSS